MEAAPLLWGSSVSMETDATFRIKNFLECSVYIFQVLFMVH